MAIALWVGVTGCSLIDPASRPEPDAPHNVRCALEYRPALDRLQAGDPVAERRLGPDLRFTALSSPYDSTKFLHSPLDLFFHAVFAPGRHLSQALEVRGAECVDSWGKGKRLPQSLRVSRDLFCRRVGKEEVFISAQTKHGSCVVVLPAGDTSPRCWVRTSDFQEKRERELDRVFGRPCSSADPGLIWDPPRR